MLKLNEVKPIDRAHQVGEVMISASEIQRRVNEMAAKIDETYDDDAGLLVVGVLKGAAFLTSDLARALRTPLLLSYTTVNSYGWKALETDGPQLTQDPDISPAGQHVLIVEDIIDSGRTLAMLAERFLEQGALSVRIAVLLDLKGRALDRRIAPDFVGFTSAAKWVCGYGIDYKEQYRGLPDIHQVNSPTH